MDAGLLDMLHDARHEGVLAVAQAIDIDLDGVGEIGVEQKWVSAFARNALTKMTSFLTSEPPKTVGT
jgi:hypothetical protein